MSQISPKAYENFHYFGRQMRLYVICSLILELSMSLILLIPITNPIVYLLGLLVLITMGGVFVTYLLMLYKLLKARSETKNKNLTMTVLFYLISVGFFIGSAFFTGVSINYVILNAGQRICTIIALLYASYYMREYNHISSMKDGINKSSKSFRLFMIFEAITIIFAILMYVFSWRTIITFILIAFAIQACSLTSQIMFALSILTTFPEYPKKGESPMQSIVGDEYNSASSSTSTSFGALTSKSKEIFSSNLSDRRCSHCNAIIPDISSFCSSCGKQLE